MSNAADAVAPSETETNTSAGDNEESDAPIILYDGPLVLWRKNNEHLDLVIALHPTQQCMEVACYNPVLDVESPRLYLDWQRFSEDVDKQRVEEKVGVAKEQWLRHVKIGEFDAEQVRKDVVAELMLKFILARLDTGGTEEDEAEEEDDIMEGEDREDVLPGVPNSILAGGSGFFLVIVPHSGDRLEEITSVDTDEHAQQQKALRILMPTAPQGIQSLVVQHHRLMNAYQVGTALNRLQREAEEMHIAMHLAELASSSVNGFQLMIQERLRLEAKHSLARLRWICAIHRVITLQTVKKVRQRVRKSKIGVWYKECKLVGEATAAADMMITKNINNALLETLLHGGGDYSPVQLAARHTYDYHKKQKAEKDSLEEGSSQSPRSTQEHRHYLKQNLLKHSPYAHARGAVGEHATAVEQSTMNAENEATSMMLEQVAQDIIVAAPQKLTTGDRTQCRARGKRGRRRQLPQLPNAHPIFEIEPHHRERMRKLNLIKEKDAEIHFRDKDTSHHHSRHHHHHTNDDAVKMPDFIARATARQVQDVNEKIKKTVDLEQALCGNGTNAARVLRENHSVESRHGESSAVDEQVVGAKSGDGTPVKVATEKHNQASKAPQARPFHI